MGIADIVPGVSGGTIAFISGIYERLITALRKIQLVFLLTVGAGIALAFVSFAPLIRYLMNAPEGYSYLLAAFFGLVLGSIYYCAKRVGEWLLPAWVALGLGIVLAFWLSVGVTGAQSEGYEVPLSRAKLEGVDLTQAGNYDMVSDRLTGVDDSMLAALQVRGIIEPDLIVYLEGKKGPADSFVEASHIKGFRWPVFFAGIAAACTLLLPGISGSYLLRLLGLYTDALANFVQVTGGDFSGDALLFLLSLGLGIVVGLLAFAQVIGWALKHSQVVTLALLTGFMVGALRSIWPWWTTTKLVNPLRLQYGLELQLLAPRWPEINPAFWGALSILGLAFFVVFYLEKLALKR